MFIVVILLVLVVVLAGVGLGLAAVARTAVTPAVPSSSEVDHPVALAVLLLGFGVLVLAPILAVAWPIPEIPGGWCGSGANHDGYTVVTVTKAALIATLIAAPSVVAAAAIFPRSRGQRITVAIIAAFFAVISVIIVLAMLGYKVDCGGS